MSTFLPLVFNNFLAWLSITLIFRKASAEPYYQDILCCAWAAIYYAWLEVPEDNSEI
jgi:hypothetical protein